MADTPIDDHVFLTGRPPIGEFLGFVRSMAVDGQTADLGPRADEWRAANDHVAALEQSEAGIADGVAPEPLTPELAALAERATAEPHFQNTHRFVPTRFATVELDRVVVYQKFINLGYVETLKATLPDSPTEADFARFAFGLGYDPPAVQVTQTGPNAYTFISPSNDLRFLERSLLRPQQVTAPPVGGRPVAYVALAVGFGSNLLSVLSVEGRLVLNNGSHRAYCLRSLGVRRAPCIVQCITRREEIDLVGSGDIQHHPDRYLKAARPPLLKDYFDPKLRTIVPVPRKNHVVRVQFGYEVLDVPST